ncbi:MAG: bifunctional aspartate kinase/homoserine dehydrogenase I [Acidobacteria bacterium]|jgi:aspartokinase/homoserine dehydrogenase 1|nr:MAG: bifunctional aspartate kinase/homoserine dehydrogenase I [Acidobacteriota bacterium]GIU83088.1 MAG: bifunctional aspartate kinase/homoserine dehydrogenase I [Pyrinomonadaceae bacterium]
MKVLKFGGSSVANSENIKKVIGIIESRLHKSSPCIVVLSAMQGVTDNLIEIAKTAEKGDDSFKAKIRELESKHIQTAKELLGEEFEFSISDFIQNRISELRSICEGVCLLKELTGKTLDRVMSFGEILSSRIISVKLAQIGIENYWKDSRQLIVTDSNFGSASVDFKKTNEKVKTFFESTKATLYVLPGFIASDENGATTTLGRGGSDYTAAILAAALDAEVLEIWTDVSGMMTADPRLVKHARQIPHISYREAMELSHFGAKVIYPPTIQPVMAKGIPVWIKNTFEPDESGTLIETEADEKKNEVVCGISSINEIALLNLEGSGMVGVPGFSKRFFGALAEEKINVILITQSSSEHSICVAVEEKFAERAKIAVDKEFENEIAVGKVEPLRIEKGFSCLAIVGDGMRSHTGLAGKMFSALGLQGVNIHAIAQGSSERNISAVIKTSDVKKAVNALHEEFFSDGKKQINLYIAGVGNVGSKLLEQIRQQAEYLSESLRLNLRVIGLANSRKMLINEDGINLDDFKSELEKSVIESNVDAFADFILENNLRNSIFVDVTASSEIVRIYPKLLKRAISIVACNKVAASSEYEKYRELKDLAREYNANFLFETNVGAGLPVINTLNDLLRSGDEIRRIEAVLSGTLQFVFNNYDAKKSFASVVRTAQEKGYTEPDPRLDLSGIDVAKKILILAREAGYRLELSDVENIGFLPESCLSGGIEEFYDQMEKHENYFKSLFEKALQRGKVLRYVAVLDEGKASVGLKEIDVEHEFARLSGKDNAVLFYTKRYSEQPLVVKGAGAGAEVTAAGIFADIIRAARI